MDQYIPEVEDVPLVLLPCTTCGRTFRPEALAKHVKVCEKTLMKKRKAFDSAKQRLQGTEVESFPAPKTTKNHPRKRETKAKERIELDKVIQAVKKPVDSPVSAHVKPSDHEECPFCYRWFGPKAFERHTQFCKEQQLKLKTSPTVNQEAKERLKVRTSYRGPLTNKVLNRDRYQPKRDPSPLSTEQDDGHKSRILTRNSSIRSSMRTRGSDTTPPPPLRRTMTQITPPKSSRRSRESVNEPENRRGQVEPQRPESTQRQSVDPHQEVGGQRPSVPRLYSKDPHSDNKDAEKYNPYLTAERQMMELFGGDDAKSKLPTALPEIPHSSPIQSSTMSAFVKYSLPKRSSSVESLKTDNNKENNNDLGDSLHSPVDKIDNHPRNFSLSNLSLCSIISLDSVDCNKNVSNSKSNIRLDELQHSFPAVDSKSNRTHGRSKINMQEMLFGSQSPEQTGQSESSNSDTGNLETCEAELLISMLEFEKMLKSSPLPSPHTSPPLCSSPAANSIISKNVNHETENRKNFKNLNNGGSIDSAYSSLTRTSGCGDGDDAGIREGSTDLPQFCHECGARYPIAAAKFCCSCGVKRLVL